MQGSAIEPKTKVEVKATQKRTVDAMKQDMQKRAPRFSTVEDANKKRVKPFLPTMHAAKYAAYKAEAKAPSTKPLGAKHTLETNALEQQVIHPALRANLTAEQAPSLVVLNNCAGATDVDGEFPPDTHGAAGLQEFVEVTNSHIDIFSKSDCTNLSSISLAAFFGYFTQGLFDPQAVYDSTWNRWIVTADAFPESPTVQRFFIAVSTTESPLGSFFIYDVNVDFFGNNNFWDYPHLGMDQDAIIITANIFDASGNFQGADMFAVAKARLYNGLGFSVPVFTGLVGTLTPPIVLDQNATTFLIAAQPSGSALQLYGLHDSSRADISLTGPVDVPVDAYDMPPSAQQPSPCLENNETLDTLDSRFVNAGTQVGDSLWQVHTINLVGFSAPRFYQINTATNSVIQSGFFFASGTSFDFNASIVANSDNDVFLNWSSTDPPPGINAQVRFSGCDHNVGSCVPGAGFALITSPTCYILHRWGDYSAVTVDPLNPRQAWLVNETIISQVDWGSQIGSIAFE